MLNSYTQMQTRDGNIFPAIFPAICISWKNRYARLVVSDTHVRLPYRGVLQATSGEIWPRSTMPLLSFLYRHFDFKVWGAILYGQEDDASVARWKPRNYWDKTAWPKVRGQRLKQQAVWEPAQEYRRPDCLTEPGSIASEVLRCES